MIKIFNLVIMTNSEYKEKLYVCQFDYINAKRNKNGDNCGNNKHTK